MMMRAFKLLSVVLAIGGCLLGGGCQSLEEMAPPVTGALAGDGGVSHGRTLFVTRCATCHGVTPVAKHTYPEWQVTVAAMAERSKLTPGEQGDILRYLKATAAP